MIQSKHTKNQTKTENRKKKTYCLVVHDTALFLFSKHYMKRKFPFASKEGSYLWSDFRLHCEASLPIGFHVDIMQLIYLFTDRGGVYQLCWNCDSLTLPFEVIVCDQRHDCLISECNECQDLTKTTFRDRLKDRCIDEEEERHYENRFMATIFNGGWQRQCIDCSNVALITSYKECLMMQIGSVTSVTSSQEKKLSSWGPCGKCYRLFPRAKVTRSFLLIPMCPECNFEHINLE